MLADVNKSQKIQFFSIKFCVIIGIIEVKTPALHISKMRATIWDLICEVCEAEAFSETSIKLHEIKPLFSYVIIHTRNIHKQRSDYVVLKLFFF